MRGKLPCLLGHTTSLVVAFWLVGWMVVLVNESRGDSDRRDPPQAPATRTNSVLDANGLLERELKAVLTDLGVPVQHIPPEFLENVRRKVRLYETRDRAEMERVLILRRHQFDAIRQQLANADLPPDVAFLPLIESHFQSGKVSPDDNAGLWQFTPDTARRNALKVNAEIDERLDPHKSTQAACRYLNRLRQEMGVEGSFMLVLAAYNMGPGRLEQRTRQMEDPHQRCDFWALYVAHVLPAVTRNHLARLMAAIVIGRNPQGFHFEAAVPVNLESLNAAVQRR
ncbi:MAG: lytic transglycosylase domain-containing protein [Terriglobia bacterium]